VSSALGEKEKVSEQKYTDRFAGKKVKRVEGVPVKVVPGVNAPLSDEEKTLGSQNPSPPTTAAEKQPMA
jgi:hypothetical protein